MRKLMATLRHRPKAAQSLTAPVLAWQANGKCHERGIRRRLAHLLQTGLKTILLVDDTDDTRVMTRWFLECFGYSVTSVPSAEEALARFEPRLHEAVVTDNRMPGMTGEELARAIKSRSPNTPLVMYTGQAPKDRSYVDTVIQKPSHLLVVKEALDKLLAPRAHTSATPDSSDPAGDPC